MFNPTSFLEQHRLPTTYLTTAARYFDPLAASLAARQRQQQQTLFVGINGCQGSGKTTLADYLVAQLVAQGLSACALSIDDFYLTRRQRQQLADDIHPLFATRGAPGTHDILLAKQTLESLATQGETALPSFDKATDDRRPTAKWRTLSGPVDVVILEGWCVATPAQDDDELITPINALERQHDPDGRWRRYSNTCLRETYADLWQQLATTIMLKAPSFEQVFAWRLEQENKLRERTSTVEHNALMSPAQIRHFIAHYERLTRHALRVLPRQVDAVFSLSRQRDIMAYHKFSR